MDEDHLAAASRHVALDPARARLVERARDWRRSSVHAHLAAREDGVTTIGPVLDRYLGFAGLIEAGPDEAAFERLRRAESIGRPLGDDRFIAGLEALTRRALKPGKRGPKPAPPNELGQRELSGLSL
jgi:putative transposase